MNKEKGITLIALVVTIIVLLILAGITIAMLTGENGMLKKSQTAGEKTNEAKAKEKVQIAVMGSYGEDGKLKFSELKTNLDRVEGIDKNTVPAEIMEDSFDLTVSVDGYNVIIKEKGEVIVKEDEGTINPPEETIKPGEIVIGGNKKYTNNGTAVIPEGFSIVPGCDDVSSGLVISDNVGDTELDSSNSIANGNQFVWVPVTNMDNFKSVEGYENGNLQNYLFNCAEPFIKGYGTEEVEYNNMRKSVEENQGFYIGRYEAGKDSRGNLVVKKNSPVYNNVKWGTGMSDITGGAVELSQNFIKGKSYQEKVTSTLIYGVQWDATMQFLDTSYVTGNCNENSYVRNSAEKGNYSGNLINTGSNENYKVKNIYDMAGNVYEWTMESYHMDYRLRRGGCYVNVGSERPVSMRANSGTTDMYDYDGFRLALYV